jgi:hypothetical protein
VESPKKRPQAEMPSGKRPAVVIETAAGERLLRELLACNSRGARAAERRADAVERRAAAAEEQARALVQLARGFGLLLAVLSQREYRPRDGAEEHGEGGEGTEKEKGAEVHMDAENGGQKETETEGRTEQEGKEKETEVIVVEGGSGLEDGVREETLDAE